MKIFKCGTHAKASGVKGKITSIEIRFNNISYELTYFDKEMNLKHIWLHESLIEIEQGEKIQIGFHTNGAK